MGGVLIKNYSKVFYKNIENYLVRWRPFYFNKIEGSMTATFIKMSLYFYAGIFFEFFLNFSLVKTVYEDKPCHIAFFFFF